MANTPESPQGPPDLDEIWRRFIKRLRTGTATSNPGPAGSPAGGGFSGIPINLPRFFSLLLLVLILVWLASGFYIVNAGSQGVILRFGKYLEMTAPGPHWHLPWPIESQAQGSPVNVDQVRTVELGYRGTTREKMPHESLMLTDDENIIDNQYAIQYTIKDARQFLFNNRNPDETVMQVAETAIREVVGRHPMDFVLYEGRAEISDQAARLMQQILDSYQTGIAISKVNMQNAQPPEQVQASFDDAVKAGQDRERLTNEAQAYANDILPKAQGTASRLVQEAKAYSQKVVIQAEGDASRFKQVQTQYAKAPEVTRQRLYQDMMQQLLSNTTKVVADQKAGNSLLYLPLDKLIQQSGNETEAQKAASAAAPAGTAAAPAEGDRSRDTFRNRDREQRP
jgi:membrane protease subunit HflK